MRRHGTQLSVSLDGEDALGSSFPLRMPADEAKDFGGLPRWCWRSRSEAADFDAFYGRHFKTVWKVASKTLRNDEDAADAVQKTFMNAWKGTRRLRRKASERAWVKTICKRVCVDILCSKGRNCLPLETDPPARQHDVDLDVALRDAIDQLPEKERRAYVLVHLRGLSVTEAAEVMGVARTTIGGHVEAAVRRLAAGLDDLPPSKEGS